ncbi:MAG: hypothetical protein NXI31_00105 [bacterium]|nr:hypothetical protein [bacterium]
MRYAQLPKVLLALPLAFVAACSGGSNDSATLKIRCGDGQPFCIISCDLGCSQTGCAITEIAENQRLKFTFNDQIAAESVNGSSFSIRTASGIAPEGDLVVEGNELFFVPGVRTSNGVSTFGFQRNESYIISIAGGPSSAFGVQSASGDTLGEEFSCTVIASLGITDADQQPPRAELVSPRVTFDAPRDPTIIVRFSELIDTTPLQGTLTASSPVRVTLRTAVEVNGVLTCNRDSSGLVLEGIPRLSTETIGDNPVTVVEFKPTVLLPSLSCVEVAVTADLRDLSGRAATPARFEFFTEAGTIRDFTVTETFANDAQLEANTSSGAWNNGASAGLIGGDGRHGPFALSYGTQVSSTEYVFDTNSVIIPSTNTLTGQSYDVTDGKFYFTEMVIPTGFTVNFVGPVPPQIRVRGRCEIEGSIKLNGAAMETFDARGGTQNPLPFIAGQPGGEPGAGGGWGGRGGNECEGTGPIIVNGEVLTNGANGEDVRLLAGHAYATQVVDTGGKGSAMNPPGGGASPNTPQVGFVYRAYYSPGGGGGGFLLAGGAASLLTPAPLPVQLVNLQFGTIPNGGVVFNPLPLPTSNDPELSLNHFTIGGSGGGGGATHAFGTLFTGNQDTYVAGAGGSGGGGACAIRAGGNLTISSSSVLEAKGGTGVVINGRRPGGSASVADWGFASPGGGGSGGSFLFQAGENLTVGATIDTSGGGGSRNDQIGVPNLQAFRAEAGAGSSGFYRLEAGGTVQLNSTGNVPAFDPGQHTGPLNDRDDFVGCTSLWYATGEIFPPTWLHYELDIDTDGDGVADLFFDDTGSPGTQAANSLSGPLRIQFQGARLTQNPPFEPLPGTAGPWRDGIGTGAGQGISLDSPTGFRFLITYNRALFLPTWRIVGLRVKGRA